MRRRHINFDLFLSFFAPLGSGVCVPVCACVCLCVCERGSGPKEGVSTTYSGLEEQRDD